MNFYRFFAFFTVFLFVSRLIFIPVWWEYLSDTSSVVSLSSKNETSEPSVSQNSQQNETSNSEGDSENTLENNESHSEWINGSEREQNKDIKNPENSSENTKNQTSEDENPKNQQNPENIENSDQSTQNQPQDPDTNPENPSNQSSPQGETNWPLMPDTISISDQDGNGFVDVLVLEYPEVLTGSIESTDFIFSRNSAQLFTNPENIISDIDVTQNAIFVHFSSSTLTTETPFLFGQDADFYFTFSPNASLQTPSGRSLAPLDEHFFKNFENLYFFDTPITYSFKDVSELFPAIIPTVQRSTSGSFSGETLICTDMPCRFNIDFKAIFSKDFPAKNFTCEMHFLDEVFTTCNPPQLSTDKNSSFSFILKEKSTGRQLTKTYQIVLPEPKPKNPENVKNSENLSSSEFFPVIIISSDGKTEKTYEWLDEDHIRCFVSECTINLNAHDSYSPARSALKFLWKFGNISESNRKNPTSIIFSSGEHSIYVRATDMQGRVTERWIEVQVPDFDKQISEKSHKNLENSENLSKISTGALDKTPEFVIPTVVLQNPLNFEYNDDEYICSVTTKSCSANFALEDVDKNFKYFWQYNDDAPIESTNPRSKAFEIGVHRVQIFATPKAGGEIIWQKTLTIIVQKITKPKIKKAKITSSKTTTKTTSKKMKTTEIEPPMTEEIILAPKDEPHLVYSLASVLFAGGLFGRLRRWKTNFRKNL